VRSAVSGLCGSGRLSVEAMPDTVVGAGWRVVRRW
jgi:hypothetical protein